MKRAWVVDRIFDGLELVASIYDRVRNLRKPGPKHDGDTDPIPLTHRSVVHIQDQIRTATEQRPPRK